LGTALLEAVPICDFTAAIVWGLAGLRAVYAFSFNFGAAHAPPAKTPATDKTTAARSRDLLL
jgi:hypothetical protein